MKNVTIVVEDDVAQWARVWAAEHGTSMSRMLGQLLRDAMEKDRGYTRAMRRDLKRKPVELKTSGTYPKREELYDRPGLR